MFWGEKQENFRAKLMRPAQQSFSLDKIIKGIFPSYLTFSFISSLITMTQQSYLPV
jgi:hypothetical protein